MALSNVYWMAGKRAIVSTRRLASFFCLLLLYPHWGSMQCPSQMQQMGPRQPKMSGCYSIWYISDRRFGWISGTTRQERQYHAV
ncbi:hypothetical protein EDB89DRAFT_1993454 [Lactarius sanguifluus]|nr:hypothetical protein EDB89DRAFT_1993454 [Lactarius sanguifluus]